MATSEEPVIAPTPTPKPNLIAQAKADIAAAKPHDPLRGIRYSKAFVGGTIKGALDGMATWGAKGLSWGAAIGVFAGIALGSIGVFGGMAVVSFLASAAVGTAVGTLTGGPKAVAREQRRDKYAEDLLQRAEIRKHAPENKADYRDLHRAQKKHADAWTAQVMTRNNENVRDTKTYWQDREAHRHNHHHERGF